MRRANPRQLGTICHLCAEPPSRQALGGVLQRTALPTAAGRGVVRVPKIRSAAGARWNTTVSPATDGEGPGQRGLVRVADPAGLARAVEKRHDEVVKAEGIPDQQAVVGALQACLEAATILQPHMRKAEAQSRASASRLAQLGAERTGGPGFAVQPELKDASGRISRAAYGIVADPDVEMTQDLLELYVNVQSQLGRPESLPSVLELYARKAKPVLKPGAGGQIVYVAQNPNAAAKAIPKHVADVALQTAIDAKNLDCALGITEASFCVAAFKRQKLIKRGSAPALGLLSLPFGVVGLGTAYASYWQNTMDVSTATGIGVAGISGYLFATGTLGLIAKLSHKAQMKRVTWLPGTPLRYRWMREEEREALDKIACAWGFKESWRYGEEMGPEWEGLREYMGYRQMILDRVEFMEGMN
ncbi:hypothetical protein N3K66_002460 [Trichothecium roseum]|uniref:Uncharacterized protein n=1 Tax=Trichothecium roseum TaxID=47278 RepID=A0ACC0VBG4_9HYPO|nr:hypothetical protein N3K66_002460 [Trichothecium roseum]